MRFSAIVPQGSESSTQLLSSLKYTQEVGDFTMTRKWKWLFVICCECKSPVSTATEWVADENFYTLSRAQIYVMSELTARPRNFMKNW